MYIVWTAGFEVAHQKAGGDKVRGHVTWTLACSEKIADVRFHSEIRVKAVLYLKNAYLTVRQIAEVVDAYYDYIGPDWDDKKWPFDRFRGKHLPLRLKPLHSSSDLLKGGLTS